MNAITTLGKEIAEKEFVDPYTPQHQLGPDYIIPTTDKRTWVPDGATEIKFNGNSDYCWPPVSVVSFFRQTVDKYSSNTALVVKRNNEWVKWSYVEYWNDVRTAAKGFIKLGLMPFHGLCILGFNSPEWLISHLAAVFAGGFSVGIYTTNSPDACFHILDDCSANVAVVENDLQLQKILSRKAELPHLKAIIQYSGTPTHPDVLTWQDLLHIGRSVPEDVLERRIKGLAVNQCCCLIYTSGTTGNPKGVMISHDNMISLVKYVVKTCWTVGLNPCSSISYLPLSHVAALGTDIYANFMGGSTVHFATPDALKGKLVDNLVEVKPTFLVAVPRVYEKICEKLRDVESDMNPSKRKIFFWARKQAQNYHTMHKFTSAKKPIGYLLARAIVLKKLKKMLGFDKVKILICGGAPLTADVFQFFLGLDIIIQQGYGLSESCGPHVVVTEDMNKAGSGGNIKLTPEQQIKIDNPDEKGCGEILLRGRNIFMGYFRLEDKTKEAIDDERWLHTGDTGLIDKDGYLFVTGRIKELIITSGGENVPPVIIEDAIKRLLPIVSNCMVVGERRKYLTIILTLKTEIDLETMKPLDKLSSPTLKWCRSVGSERETVSSIVSCKDENVYGAIQEAIDNYNKNEAISQAQRIQKWRVLLQDFCISNGELGPTAKLKRDFILEKYASVIEEMYAN